MEDNHNRSVAIAWQAFWDMNSKQAFSTNETRVYFLILRKCELAGKDTIEVEEPRLAHESMLSLPIYRNARKALVEIGLLEHQEGNGRGNKTTLRLCHFSSRKGERILQVSTRKRTDKGERILHLSKNEQPKPVKFFHLYVGENKIQLLDNKKFTDKSEKFFHLSPLTYARGAAAEVIVSLFKKLRELQEQQHRAPVRTHTRFPDEFGQYVLVGFERIGPDEIGPLLKIRGYTNERIGAFVHQHHTRKFSTTQMLREAVIRWLASPVGQTVILTIEERKAQFYEEIQNFARDHPGLYPKAFYDNFFDFWATPDDNTGLSRRDERQTFNLEYELKKNHERYWKQRPNEHEPIPTGQATVFSDKRYSRQKWRKTS